MKNTSLRFGIGMTGEFVNVFKQGSPNNSQPVLLNLYLVQQTALRDNIYQPTLHLNSCLYIYYRNKHLKFKNRISCLLLFFFSPK